MSAKQFINDVERNTILDGDIFEFSKISYKPVGQKVYAAYN